jgi:hypothetical protein
MTTPQEPAPDSQDTGDAEDAAEPEKESDAGNTADDVDEDGPLDADEGDPQLDSYPG